jgi:hypothetical protein
LWRPTQLTLMLVSAGLVSHSHQRLVEVGYLIEPDLK